MTDKTPKSPVEADKTSTQTDLHVSPHQERVLHYLMHHSEAYPLQMTEPCDISHGNIHMVCLRLERRGFVTSELRPRESGRGGPNRWYRLTKKGRQAYWHHASRALSHAQWYFSDLSTAAALAQCQAGLK